jgi:hypothetical protein
VELRTGADFKPLREKYIDEEVQVEILAGMWAAPPEDDGPEDSKRRDNTSGWYVVCNGRAVLSADRTTVTGWGIDDIPKWHSQYGGFLGLCFFSSAKSALLPMTTTKRSVDLSSGVYRRALAKMVRSSREWIDYTNERKHDLSAARSNEEKAKPVPLAKVEGSVSLTLPKVTKRDVPKEANILYKMPEIRVRNLASAFGDINLSYREVGIKSFEYAFDDLVEESE